MAIKAGPFKLGSVGNVIPEGVSFRFPEQKCQKYEVAGPVEVFLGVNKSSAHTVSGIVKLICPDTVLQ